MSLPRMRLLCASLGVLAATGCTYIGQDALNSQLCLVDEDGDGVTQLNCNDQGVSSGILDCNDQDPAINPDVVEIPYDGIDQDCDQLELVDVDGDGYPGITPEAFEALGGNADWPTDVNTALDCDDNDPDTHPDASDVWYDGVDNDCEANDDFDKDGDGWVPAEYADSYTGPLKLGDCDDNRDDVNPDMPASSDDYYDGVDNDCAGNNDFDADGDGWMPAEPPFEGLSEAEWRGFFAEYESFYGYDFPDNWGDCREEADANLDAAGIGPADVWGTWEYVGDDLIGEGAVDVPYDAVDANCDGLNDFDVDLDGYMPDQAGNEAAYEEFKTWWGAFFFEEWGDCDDGRDDIHPLVPERLGDAHDHDCDGDIDTTALGFSEDAWTSPRPAVIGATDEHYVIVTSADVLDLSTGTSALDQVGRYLLFNRAAIGYLPTPSYQDTWQGLGSTPPLGDGLDALFLGDRFYAATSYFLAGASYLLLRENLWNGASYQQTSATVSVAAPLQYYSDVDIQQAADGAIWAVGCSTSRLHFAVGTDDGGFATEGGALSEDFGGDVCFVEPPAAGLLGTAVACDIGNGCTSYDIDATLGDITVAAAQPYAGLAAADIDTVADTLVVVRTTTGVDVEAPSGSYTVLTDRVVHHADVSWLGSVLYVAATVDDLNEDGAADAVLAYGDPTLGPLVQVEIPMQTPDGLQVWNVESANVFADDAHIALALTGTAQLGAASDKVAWMFWDQP